MAAEMSLQDRLYHLGHDYPGGVPALAQRMGKNPTVLMHKLNPHNTTHHITAHELDALDDLTGTLQIAEYFAHKRGYLLVPGLDPAECGQAELMQAFIEVNIKWGAYCSEFQIAMADGKVTKEEWKAIKRRGVALRQELVSLTDRILMMVED